MDFKRKNHNFFLNNFFWSYNKICSLVNKATSQNIPLMTPGGVA